MAAADPPLTCLRAPTAHDKQKHPAPSKSDGGGEALINGETTPAREGLGSASELDDQSTRTRAPPHHRRPFEGSPVPSRRGPKTRASLCHALCRDVCVGAEGPILCAARCAGRAFFLACSLGIRRVAEVRKTQSVSRTDAKQSIRVPVTVRALMSRINRALAPDGKELKITRGVPAIDALGRYYVLCGNSVFSDHIDLEAFGRELGALAGYERLLDEG